MKGMIVITDGRMGSKVQFAKYLRRSSSCERDTSTGQTGTKLMPFFAQINAHFRINLTILYSGLFSPIWHTCFARLNFSEPGVSCLWTTYLQCSMFCWNFQSYKCSVEFAVFGPESGIWALLAFITIWVLFANDIENLDCLLSYGMNWELQSVGILCFNSGRVWIVAIIWIVQIFDAAE